MYSGPVVIMFQLGIQTKEKKTRRKSPIQQLVLSSGRGRERVPKLPERSDDPFALPLKARVEKNSRWFPMKANRSERAQKLSVRWAIVDINSSSHAGEQIDACSKTERAVSDC